MSVKINYLGRLGNNILQYLMGQFLAVKFNLSFDETINLNDDFDVKKYENGRSFDNVLEINDDNIISYLEKETIDHGIWLNGYFQNKEIFLRQEVIDFYRNTIVPKSINNPSDLFVHVRLGDIQNNFNLPYFYYKNQLSKINYNTCFLSSDSIDNEIVNKIKCNFKNISIFDGWQPSFIIRYAANCDKILLSAGSFSFCMALFRIKDSEVYCIDNEVMVKQLKIKQWDGGMFSAFLGKENFHFYNR